MLTKDSSSKEVVAEWVKELRSGDYRQGKDYLRVGDMFCCLGVLCDMAVKAEVIPVPKPSLLIGSRTNFDYAGETKHLPREIQHWTGILTPFGSINEAWSLVYRNDCGDTFSEIADVIESRPKGLFVEENGESISTNTDPL